MQKIVIEPVQLGAGQLFRIDEHDAVFDQLVTQFQPALVLIVGELRHLRADARQLLGGDNPSCDTSDTPERN